MVPTGEAVAELLAAALNGYGLGVEFTRNRWPKYAAKDLTFLRADVVCEWPWRMEAIDDGGTATETQVAVLIQRRCEKTDVALVDELSVLLETVAQYVAATDLPDVGYPVEDLVVARDDELLDRGHFLGGVGVIYRVHRDAPEGLL